MLDHDILDAGQVKAILERGDEEDLCLGPEGQAHLDRPIARLNDQALSAKVVPNLLHKADDALVEHLKRLDLVKEPHSTLVTICASTALSLSLSTLFLARLLTRHIVASEE